MPIEDQAEINSSFDEAYNAEVVDGGTEETAVEGLDEGATGGDDTVVEGDTGQDGDTGGEENAGDDEPEIPEGGAEKGSDEYNKIVEQIARRMKKDTSDPEQLKDVQTVVDKELHIRKLEAENRQLKGEKDGQETLTEFEKKLLQGDKGEPDDDATGDDDTNRPHPESQFNWKNAKEAYSAELKAWQDQDFDRLNEIRTEITSRQIERAFIERGANGQVTGPSQFFAGLVDQIIQNRLGGVLPGMQEIVSTNMRQQAQSSALNDVESVYPDVRGLFKEDGGQPIVDNGRKLPSTPFNRITTEYPEVLDISVQHPDPATAARLTATKVIKAAYRIHQMERGSSKKNKRLLEAGIKTGQRTEQEKSRQGLNKGSGTATSAGDARKGYADILREGRGKRLGDF